MRAAVLGCLLGLCSSALVNAQTIQIRQNVNVTRDIAKPAFVVATFPEDNPATYQVGLGLLADLTPEREATQLILDALFEYQRNNATDALQDTAKAGLSGEYQLRPIDPLDPTGPRHTDSGLLSFRANFAQNRVKDTRGVQEAIYYTHVFVGQRRVPMPNLPFRFGNALELEYVPTAGMEFEHVLSAASADTRGSTGRLLTQANIAVYPAPVAADLRVELLGGFAWRYDVLNGPTDTTRSHPLLTFEGNYYAVRTSRAQVGFGVSFVRGEDPDDGFEHQQYWQLALKLRLK